MQPSKKINQEDKYKAPPLRIRKNLKKNKKIYNSHYQKKHSPKKINLNTKKRSDARTLDSYRPPQIPPHQARLFIRYLLFRTGVFFISR